MKNKRKNGELYWASTAISPLINKNGDITNFVAIESDITEKIKTRKELIKAKEFAEQSNKVKDGFIANMSHEIRTPLSGILGMTSLIKETFEDQADEDDKIMFESIEISSHRLIRTMEMILNYSRLQAGELKADKEKVDLVKIISDLMIQFEGKSKNKNLLFNFENDLLRSSVIMADEFQLSSSISNLIDNAIKYTNEGFVKLRIYENEINEILLTVSDSGIGIGKDKIDDIFNPFIQEDMGVGRKYEGVGLGLSIVKKYLELNGFQINVVSEKNKGTSFTINFGNQSLH